ncbi:MAG: FHA domain-containing protein [Verrucomicrobia bacterium]|nr:FHA domain-containing protein [Verrucomicrobiota bacterium]MBV8278068.1 FHA domain-containing protein [Verrucomicrobiota bacterium]
MKALFTENDEHGSDREDLTIRSVKLNQKPTPIRPGNTATKTARISVLSGLSPRSETVTGYHFVVGRASDADLVLDFPEVSRRHCRFVRKRGSWFIEDLGSRYGTMVNGNSLSGRTALSSGDEILVGRVILVFEVTGEQNPDVWDPDDLVLYKAKPVETIPVKTDLVFGRGDEVDVVLDDPVISRLHAKIEIRPDGCRLSDLQSRTGSFVNSRRFAEHDMVIGDQIRFGPFSFLYDGKNLQRIRRPAVGRIIASGLTKGNENGPILKKTSFVAEPGQFIGILGPSGAGKTTLLNALSGLRPAERGKILIDQTDFYKNLDRFTALFGYVPQDDIVHAELTVVEALTFAARLRLPAGIPGSAITKLVSRTISDLGLSDRGNVRIDRLSGGQRKRVSVGVELLSRPPILFLDEPTSGLDPLAEFKVMEFLRRLADNGCTVICTTHVMENVYLMDQIAIMSKGQVLFQGPPDEAQTRFGISRLNALYGAVQNLEAEKLPCFEAELPSEVVQEKAASTKAQVRPRKAFALPILLKRQSAIFRADIKNFIMLLAQPIIIGALVACATTDGPLTQFYIYIATLWFGCSNSAQEIVRELPIYRRERRAGLSRLSYLVSKLVWMGGLTAFQSLLLFTTVALIHFAVLDDVRWQILGLVLLAFASTGIGLAISAVAKSAMQAVMLVPLFLIPQIVLSGFSPPAHNMPAPVRYVSQVMPSFASERISDVSFLLRRKITGDLITGHLTAYSNINDWYRSKTGERLTNGMIYTDKRPLWMAYLSLVLWTVGGFLTSVWLLARKERPK